MTPLARRGALTLLAAALLGAGCGGSETRPDAPKPAVEPDGRRPLSRRGFANHLDAVESRYLPQGEFEPGHEVVAAAIHSGVHASLFFLATRGTIPLHVHKTHEETLFVYSGTGHLLLPGGKTVALEAGWVVRVPPGVCHGFAGNKADPIKAIDVLGPAVEGSDFEECTADLPGTLDRAWAQDVTSTAALEALESVPLGAPGDSVVKRRFLHESRWSTLQVTACRRASVPGHRHASHDETVIVFAQAGKGFLRLDEVMDPVEPGSIAHLPEGCVHSFQHVGEGHARWISIFTGAYDGRDSEEVVESAAVKPPPGYQRTREDEFLPEGQHSGGEFVAPRREQINLGPAGPAPPR